MAERAGRKAAREHCARAGYVMGGHFAKKDGGAADDAEDKGFVRSGVGQHEDAMHPGKARTRLNFQDGGSTSGTTARSRHDRSSRSSSGHGKGKSDGHPRVNILIHNPPAGGPPAGPAAGAGPPLPPSRPPMPPPGAGPGMPPGAMPPGMGPGMPPGAAGLPPGLGQRPPMPPMGAGPGGPMPPGAAGLRPPGMKGGGSTGPGRRSMEYGAGSGAGRLEKIGREPPSY